MENLIDKSDFQFVSVNFLTPCGLAAGMLGSDFDGEVTLPYLERLVNSQQPILKELSLLYYEVLHNHNKTTGSSENGYYIPQYKFIWGRMIVEFYYFYHSNLTLAKTICDLMLESLSSTMISGRVKRGMEMIDEYYTRSQQLDEELLDTDMPADSSPFFIAEGSKTDVMKVLSYLYDLNVFTDKKNQPLKRKKTQFMISIGKFLNSDFENYAQTINKAAQEEHFMDVFHNLLDLAQKKYIDEV